MNKDEIKEFREKALGVSQERFARMLEISSATVHKWESGKANPSKEHVRILNSTKRFLDHKINESKGAFDKEAFIKIAMKFGLGGILASHIPGVGLAALGLGTLFGPIGLLGVLGGSIATSILGGIKDDQEVFASHTSSADISPPKKSKGKKRPS